MEDTVCADLVTDSDCIAGVVLIDVLTGEIRSIPAKAVVMATGGSHNLFSENSGPTDCCGEGQAMALRAGAELVDMEMISFCPAVIKELGKIFLLDFCLDLGVSTPSQLLFSHL